MLVGILKGNGIGPEITEATKRVLEATGLPFEWEDIPIAGEAIQAYGHPLPPETVQRLRTIKHTLKAPLIVEKLEGRLTCVQPDGSARTYPSLNNAIRRELGLFVNPRPIRGYPGVSGRHAGLDAVVVREVTEDVYAGHEHALYDSETGVDIAAEAVKLTTRAAATRAARWAFDYARRHRRRRVTCLHKANVLGLTDGLFLRCFRDVARDYSPDIQADDMMIDAACYAAVRDPARFDVVLASNQYGDIFSDLLAGLAGSLGLAPGANFGADGVAVYEACHGAAPDIAGRGIANPLALILSGAELLDTTGHSQEAAAVREAIRRVIEAKTSLTPDLGGSGTTDSLASAVCDEVKWILAS